MTASCGIRSSYDWPNEPSGSGDGSPRTRITFRAEASDNIGLESVVFSVGNRELIRQAQPPYAVPWRVTSGEHTLRVEAIDLAGNTSETSIQFVVEE